MLVTGIGDSGALTVFEFSDGKFQPVWSTITEDVARSTGARIGDVNNDGNNDFVLMRRLKSAKLEDAESVLEAWTYDPATQSWRRLLRQGFGKGPLAGTTYVGAIMDLDADGLNEILVTNSLARAFEVWGNKQRGAGSITKLATVATLSEPDEAVYIKTAADLNGNGVPEILTHGRPRASPDDPEVYDIVMYEHHDGKYIEVGRVPSPIVMMDVSDSGDVNRDGRPDIVFCGNSSTSHVLTFREGKYRIDYTAPKITSDGPPTFTQACNAGYMTSSGGADWVDVGNGLIRGFTFRNQAYAQLWQAKFPPGTSPFPSLGASAIGDADNDGRAEFLNVIASKTDEGWTSSVYIWRTTSAAPVTLDLVYTLPQGAQSSAVAVGKLR